MKKFQFGLGKLLDFRRGQEDLALGRFGAAVSELSREQSRLEQLRDELRKRQESFILDSRSTRRVDDLNRLRERLMIAQVAAEKQFGLVKNLHDKVEGLRVELIGRTKDRRVLEELRSRHYEDYAQEYLQDMQRELDDISGKTAGRREWRAG